MIDFLKDSEDFAGIAFSGMFNMNLTDLQGLYDHYKETGENLIDDYCLVYRLSWKDTHPYYKEVVDGDVFNRRMSALSNMKRIGYFDPDYIREQMGVTRHLYEEHIERQKRKTLKPRREASKYISKKKIRKAVFKKYGKACLNCGSTKKIQIDHIVSVHNGGENSLDNLQPLCKYCNVSKGTKTIDYRDNE